MQRIASASQHKQVERQTEAMIAACTDFTPGQRCVDSAPAPVLDVSVFHNEIPGAEWYAVYWWLR